MTVFIKTHGRPDKQLTYHTLREAGYTGDIIFVVDDEDNTVSELMLNVYGNQVVSFNKQLYIDKIDSGVSNPKRNVNLYSWCACEDIAEERNIEYFVMADDDITGFRYRYKDGEHLRSLRITKNLDSIFELIKEYMFSCNIASMSTGIPQMYFSKDIESNLWKWRVPYTFVFRNSNYKMSWVSEYEEDIITAINSSIEGKYMSVFPMIQRDTVNIGSNDGGMHDSYIDTFRNAQYGYMWHPSCEEIISYKNKWMCQIKRDNAFPKIVSSNVSKSRCKC